MKKILVASVLASCLAAWFIEPESKAAFTAMMLGIIIVLLGYMHSRSRGTVLFGIFSINLLANLIVIRVLNIPTITLF